MPAVDTAELGQQSENTDAVILSNIIGNLYPNDAEILLEQTKRILKRDGKILIKLNQYLNREQIEKYNIKSIGDELLDDGLLLWNRTDNEWSNLIEKYFKIKHHGDIYYPEHQQTNRIFLAEKL